MAADPAAARLIEIANDKSMPPAVRLAANKEILDRANVVGTQQVAMNVELSTFEKTVRDVVVRWDEFDDGDQEYTEDAVVVEDAPERDAYDEETRDIEKARLKMKRQGKVPFTPASRSPKAAPPPETTPAFYDPTAGKPLSDEAWRAAAYERAGTDRPGLRPKRRAQP